MKNNCENCGNCCKQTEMILSEKDTNLILNIDSMNLRKEDIIQKNSNGFYQLKNEKGYCVFFESHTKLCKVYEFRPQGCRFYPLIYDFDLKKCVFDKDCLRTDLFYVNKEELKDTCKKIKNFLKEYLKIKFNNY